MLPQMMPLPWLLVFLLLFLFFFSILLYFSGFVSSHSFFSKGLKFSSLILSW